MAMYSQRRLRVVKRVEAWLRYNDTPRFHMFLIVGTTGSAAFLFSFVLLHLGLDSMCIRYAIAVAMAYLVFLILLRVWLNYQENSHSYSTTEEILNSLPTDGSSPDLNNPSRSNNKDSSLDGDLPIPDLDDLTYVVIAVLAVLAGFLVCVYLIWTAPALLAEVAVDGIIMARIYKKLKVKDEQYWLTGAIRRTWIPALLIALFFSVAGFAMQKAVPGAKSVGPVIQHIFR